MYQAVDVMGFAGGFTLGVVQAGFTLTGKCELPGGFGVPNCEVNRALLGSDWNAYVGEPKVWKVLPGTDVVFGNPPCSGFSLMSSKKFRGADSKINDCMWKFADYVIRARPTIAVFESVQQAYRSADGLDLMRRLRAHVEEGTGDRWDLHHVLHNAYSVGGAAQRRRYFWLISRIPFGIEREPPDHLPVLNDIIGDLAPLARSWYPQVYRHEPSRWVKRECVQSVDGSVDGHVQLLNPLTGRIGDLLRGVPWKPGESIADVVRRYWDTYACLPKSLNEEKIIKNDFKMGFTTPTRWRGDGPARVVTGGAMVMIVHPWLDRTITHREAARILGFPDDWRIEPLRHYGQNIGMTWGKGITVQCGRWIARWIKQALDGNPGTYTGVAGDADRERIIDVTNDWKLVPSLT